MIVANATRRCAAALLTSVVEVIAGPRGEGSEFINREPGHFSM
jgi:hypothetical protein